MLNVQDLKLKKTKTLANISCASCVSCRYWTLATEKNAEVLPGQEQCYTPLRPDIGRKYE